MPAYEYLEDEDLLEMMNVGLIPMIVIDSHKAKFWAQVFQDLKLHPDIKLRSGGQIAWAVRQSSPRLQNVMNRFIKSHQKGTLKGNILYKRYLQNTKWVRNALAENEFQRFKDAVGYFKNEPMDPIDKMLFTFASYNAGPGRVIRLRKVAQQSGFNPNIWFRNVEIIAARRIGAETIQYVGNIYKYYIAYRFIVEEFNQKKKKKFGQIKRLHSNAFALPSH